MDKFDQMRADIHACTRIDALNDLKFLAFDHSQRAGLLRQYEGMTWYQKKVKLTERIKEEVVEACMACDEEPGSWESELADIILTTMTTAAYFGVDIGKEVERKRRFNETRGFMHGKEIKNDH